MNKLNVALGISELVKKIRSLRSSRSWGMCDKIKKPINKIILGKVLPASPFASTNCYRSEEPSKNLALREGQLQFVIAICNL